MCRSQALAQRGGALAATFVDHPPQCTGQWPTESHGDGATIGLQLGVSPDDVGNDVAEQQTAEEDP